MFLFQVILLLVYYIMPLPIKTIMLVGDLLMKDSLPIVDEVLMILMYFNSVERTIQLFYFFRSHKIVTVVGIVLIVMLYKNVF